MQPDLSFDARIAQLDEILRVEESFDLIKRPMTIADQRAVFYMVDGFVKDEVMEKIMAHFISITPEDLYALADAQAFANRYVTYVEVDITQKLETLVRQVLSGTVALVLEPYTQAILIDARTYPVRGVEEPADDRVLRGAHDGFVETLVFNTALIRRRIRDPRLTMQIHSIGKDSKTDVVLCYMDGKVNPQHLKQVQKRIGELRVSSLTMGQESLNEALIRRGWYNPFPKVRFTERPDTAAANLYEGRMLLLIDTSPSAIILPVSLFDFTQECNDFYFPPLVGTYLRFVRLLTFFVTIFLTPLWYLLIQNPHLLPSWLSFVQVAQPAAIPIFLQLIIFELVIDGLKLASLNTPSSLSNSFSILGALILGELAIQTNWFVPEVLMYMAFVAIGNFSQPSLELGYAFKICRMLLIVLTGIFHAWGFLAGLLIILLLIATNHTVTGTSYLYPLIPFHGKALLHLFVRRRINHKNS